MGYFGIPFRNGVPIGLGSVASFGAQQFDPSSLFIGGTAGTWYDPSDPTTLFTTSTGTTPCAVPGSGSQVLVGLMLDKSQGLVLGSELLADSGFNNAASWQSNAGVTISGGEAIWNTATNSVYVRQPLITTANTYYEFTVVCSSYTAGTVFVGIGAGGTNLTSFPINAVGTVTFRINVEANSGTVWLLTPTGGAQLSITSFSVRQVSGNHAIAFNDTTARPELSARVNLLTYSEQFENAAWATTAGVTFSENIATFSSTAYRYQSRTGLPTITGQTYIIRAKLSSSTGKATILLRMANGSSGADSVSQLVNLTATPTVYTLTRTFIAAGTAIDVGLDNRTALGGDGIAGDVVATEWDLRPANIGSAIPSYQRIADQYTYDSNGFPSYLRFDGVDDSMYTPASINFSGTDKMSVFAGVRKLSDAARGMVTELSAVATNPGTFYVAAPDTNGAANYGMYLDGPAFYQPVTYAAPITNVLAVLFDRFGTTLADKVIPRINGVTNQSGAGTNIASGNFGTYPLYIGSRNNASLRFNGQLYSLVVVGSTVSAGSITATEQYVAGKTGVQI